MYSINERDRPEKTSCENIYQAKGLVIDNNDDEATFAAQIRHKCAMCMCLSARIKQNCPLVVNLIDYNFIFSNGHGWWCVTEEKKEVSEKKKNVLREDASFEWVQGCNYGWR